MKILYKTKRATEVLLAFGFRVIQLAKSTVIEVETLGGKKKRFNIKNLIGGSRK